MVNELLSRTEGKTLEFKRDLSSPKPLLKTLVAFANTAGGKLVIGIDDTRQIIGVSNPLDEEERLYNLIADSIAPRLAPNMELLTVDGKTLLVEVLSQANSSLVKEPRNRNEVPAEFEALRRTFNEICDLLESEPPSNLNPTYERQEFKADFDCGFKSGAWSWTPITKQVDDEKIDRLGEVLMGPLFSSEDHPWPEQDKAPMAPLIQVDLRVASEIGGVQLGDGLLQVWMPKYEFAKPVFIRVIPRQDVDPLKLTPIVAVPADLDPLQPRDEEWSDEVGGCVLKPAIQITGYAPKRFTFQIRFPIQSNYPIKNLTQREETSLRIKEFDKKIKPLLKKGPKGYHAGNCHLFGTFTPIQYKSDAKPTPLFCFESDEFGFYWGDGGTGGVSDD